jgi:hypothetical protein
MATMAKAQAGWTPYAILASAKDPNKSWTVQRHETGTLRCNCPAYIFSKGPVKSCKHIRRVQQDVAAELATSKAEQQALRSPLWDAQQTVARMLAQARLDVSQLQMQILTSVLAVRLAQGGGSETAMTTGTAAVMGTIGVRRITFEE